jgi:lipopolysaccharide export system protein LptC
VKGAADTTGQVWASGVLLVVVIAAGALFLIRTIGPDAGDFEPGASVGEPDVRMEGARLRRFDASGALEYALVAPEVRYFRNAGRAEITSPDLTLYEDARTVWRVSSRLGTLLGSGVGGKGEDEIRLEEDVLLEPLEGRRLARLATQSLTLYPDRQYAETDQAVMIDGEGGRTAAAGLEGDLQGGLLKLLSSAERPVQTILLPRQFK